MTVCRFFLSSDGCKFGADCRFDHVRDNSARKPEASGGGTSILAAKRDRKPVPRPVPKTLQERLERESDPSIRAQLVRDMEVSQVLTRYAPVTKINFGNGEISLNFVIVPSDPDFPFDLSELSLELTIPPTYPVSREININVLNKELPAKYIDRIRNEFRRKARESGLCLLDLIKWLDRQLESFFIDKQTEPSMAIRFVNPKTELSFPIPSEAERIAYYAGQDSSEDGSSISSEESDEMENVNVEEPCDDRETSTDPSFQPVESTAINVGTHIKLKELQFKNISLIQCQILNLLIKCLRCKQLTEFSCPSSSEAPVSKTCSKCSTILLAKFYNEFAHSANNRIGHVKVEGGTVFDILPSDFLVTCENCAKNLNLRNTTNGLTKNNCRTCHWEMQLIFQAFRILEVGARSTPTASVKKNKLVAHAGIKQGTPLPNFGSCSHYKKSFRWFRFPCCGKLYPCDVCHMEKDDSHEIEWANKMVCGYCSKEQPYSQKKLCTCGNSLTGKATTFWNGGKGMRDKLHMSRKDSKKFAGLSKTVSNKKV
jgi:hypothetical protein